MVTVKQLKDQIRKHNKKQCIRLSQRKAGLISSLSSVQGGSAPASAPAPAQQQQQKKKKKTRVSLQTTPFGAGGPSVSAFDTGGGSSSSKSSKKKKKKKKKSSGFLPSNLEGQQSFNKKMKTLKKKSKKGKDKDAAPNLAFGGAYSDAYYDV